MQCIQPEVIPYTNGTTDGDFYLGDVVFYVCVEGWQPSKGDFNLTCGPDGFWLGTWPVCKSKFTVLRTIIKMHASFSQQTYKRYNYCDYTAIYYFMSVPASTNHL